MSNQQHRPGTLRYFREDGEEVITSPGNPLYSTATMCATEYWSVEEACWKPIFEPDEAD